MSLTDVFWKHLSGSEVYDLAHPLESTIPISPNHPAFHMFLTRRHGDMMRSDGSSAASELIVTGGHVGTHMDALAHVSYQGRLHGGVDALEAQSSGRFQHLGIDQVEPILCRGVLLDVARLHDTDGLGPGKGIGADDLRQAATLAGVQPRSGDAVLVRSGWAKHWGNPPVYLGQEGGAPGVDLSAAELIAEWGAVVTGHDSLAYEQIQPGDGHRLLPVHRLLLVEKGIFILENLNLDELARDRIYEFLFIVIPLKIVGATGSPVRPIAVVL